MPRIFKISNSEISAIQTLLNIPYLPLTSHFDSLTEDALYTAIQSLTDKRYLAKSPEGTYQLNHTLSFLFQASQDPYGIFKMEHSDGTNKILVFINDTIILFQEDAEGVDAMWLPHLPITVGFVANTLEPFMNCTSDGVATYGLQVFDSILNNFIQQGYQTLWTCTTQCKEDQLSNQKCLILSSGTEQVLMTIGKTDFCVSRPAKADLVNALTQMYAPIHGRAIKDGGILNDNV